MTTRNSDGTANVAPMGPWCSDAQLASFELRPFCTSTTYQNLKRTGQGVLHVTDDVLLFARSAIGHANGTIDLIPAESIPVDCLADCCRRYEFESKWIDDSGNRSSIHCRTLHVSRVRDFFGFNRARHAIIEASILASRIDFLPLEQIQEKFGEYQVMIKKTGGAVEHLAFQLLSDFVSGHETPPQETVRRR